MASILSQPQCVKMFSEKWRPFCRGLNVVEGIWREALLPLLRTWTIGRTNNNLLMEYVRGYPQCRYNTEVA